MSEGSAPSERGGPASLLNTPLQQPESSPFIHNTAPHSGPAPIPVDFTDAFKHRGDYIGGGESKKRSFSATQEDAPAPQQFQTLPSIENLDPALPRAAVAASSAKAKEDRRAELQREAERMRAMLEAKERELAELSDEG
ncbi:hypothetical protein BST61_g11075 [Cercospora zeina]